MGMILDANLSFVSRQNQRIPDVLNYSIDIYGKVPVTLILGDNIFASSDMLSYSLLNNNQGGAKIFATKVDNPSRFGVQFNNEKN